MKKTTQGIVLFLVLLLILSSSISYMGLYKVSKKQEMQEVQTLSVALVNEDEGAILDGQYYDFGEEFVKNIEKNNEHDWYVVSRGVAENGLDRNAYNMMIVIPTHFSEQALSIHSEIPEKVQLNYKINVSDNKDLKAEAEKTAALILNDFNKRIIDVYFASVIGNLQDAQDNIGTIIKKEAAYTNKYKTVIHNPLDNYTMQFQNVQNYTSFSKDAFNSFQGFLNGFNGQLNDGFETNHDYFTILESMSQMKEKNNFHSQQFSQQLNNFEQNMNEEEVLNKLDKLETGNKAVYMQFQQPEYNNNIFTESYAIKEYLKQTNQEVSTINNRLTQTLESELNEKVKKRLQVAFNNGSGHEKIYLNQLFLDTDDMIRKKLQTQIEALPSLNVEDLDYLDLTDQTKIPLKNVIAVTNKYNDEFNYKPMRKKNGLPLIQHLTTIKDSLATSGIVVIDKVVLPETKTPEQIFKLHVPDNYEVIGLMLTLPGKEEENYTNVYMKDQKVTLPETSEGLFTIKLSLRLKDASSSIDLFDSLLWNWEIVQKDITGMNQSNSIIETNPSFPHEPSKEVLEEKSTVNEGTGQEENTVDANTSEEKQSETIEQKREDTNNVGKELVTKESKQSGEETNQKDSQPIEKVKVIDQTIHHQVMSPLENNNISELIEIIKESIEDYERLLLFYELYFGLNMTQESLLEALHENSLTQLATDTSLYNLLNEREISTIMVDLITNDVTRQIYDQVNELKQSTDSYYQLVDKANQKSDELATMIIDTQEQTEVLNTTLGNTLNELSKWREKSMELVDEQGKILINSDEEQLVMLHLDNEFQSIIKESQLLKEQSNNILQSTENMYELFDAIDQQANDIKNSGATLIDNANQLSKDLTNKLVKDQHFSENFTNVLANSRIGERQNENLYDFLSNPVQTKSNGLVVAGDTLTPYFLVLICFISSLFTAYVIATYEQKQQKKGDFEENQTIMEENALPTLIIMSIGIIEGLVIGIISGYYLKINSEDFIGWIGIIMLVMVAMLVIATYLLRQMKMIGMFILLLLFSMYLFLAEALQFSLNEAKFVTKIRTFSPLQYIDQLFYGYANDIKQYKAILYMLGATLLIGIVANLFVVHRSKENEEKIDESITDVNK